MTEHVAIQKEKKKRWRGNFSKQSVKIPQPKTICGNRACLSRRRDPGKPWFPVLVPVPGQA